MFQLIYTVVLMTGMLLLIARDVYKPSLVAFGTLILLVLGGVISTQEAFAGFSNHGMLTVGLLFVVSAALQVSGLFERFILYMLGDGRGGHAFRYVRLLFPVAMLSAFLNNTPIVATLIPLIKNWARRHNLAASKYLIPLSYAAILGGMCTLIETSTNLIVHGMLLENGFEGFSFFEISKLGLPVAFITLVALILLGPRILPDRKEPIVQLGEQTREFVVEMKVDADYPHLGKTIKQANLRHLRGLYLFQINRGDQVIAPVSHNEVICENDRFFFTGLPETIIELQKTPGLHIIKDQEYDLKNYDSDALRTFEVVISNNSPLIGQTVRDSNFRQKYGGVILAIHRSGTRVNKKVGDIVFQPTDTLFILAKRGFDKTWYYSPDFSLVTTSVNVLSKPKWKGNLALAIMALMILAAACKVIPIVIAAALAAIVLVLLKIISGQNAVQSVNWDVLLYIASSFGIARALANSGLADILANSIVNALDVFGSLGIIAGVFVVTSAFTWLITNNAVAAIMFPVTLSIAQTLNTDPRPFMMALAIGASTCFATPIGYQTNLMVYSAGGYRFKDFLKIGIPATVFVSIAAIGMIYWLYF